jgi:small subunit ribosomal protein S16
MKVKFKLLQRGVKQRPYWHIIVQPDKKNLKGHYIEKVGYWMPRKTGTIPRGILLNKHRIRYWLSVGAQPTNGVVRLFNRFGNDFFPKLPTPFGSNSTFERPAKTYAIEGAKNDWEW